VRGARALRRPQFGVWSKLEPNCLPQSVGTDISMILAAGQKVPIDVETLIYKAFMGEAEGTRAP
jgi:hypothetical protein